MSSPTSPCWPAITSVDLPSGGPSPPLAALGARLLVNVGDNLSVLGGVFDGNQAGPGPDDPQQRDRYGVNFRINDPPLALAQIQYSWNSKKGDPNLAGNLKLGGWRNFAPFSDLRFASNGVSLASPASSGTPAMLSGNFGVWAVIEQQLYRVPKSDDQGVGPAAFPPARRTAALLTSIPMRGSSSSVSTRRDLTTSSASRPAMHMSRGTRRHSTEISAAFLRLCSD